MGRGISLTKDLTAHALARKPNSPRYRSTECGCPGEILLKEPPNCMVPCVTCAETCALW